MIEVLLWGSVDIVCISRTCTTVHVRCAAVRERCPGRRIFTSAGLSWNLQLWKALISISVDWPSSSDRADHCAEGDHHDDRDGCSATSRTEARQARRESWERLDVLRSSSR